MAYTPTTWVNDVTKLNATHMNNIEAGIVAAMNSKSVKDYGALGDGSTDDATNIQAALDAANAAGGGFVFFPAGTYIVGATLTIYSKVNLIGAGPETTIIKLKNSANVDIFKSLNFASLTGTASAAGIHSFSFRDMTIDGNKANNAVAGYGIRVYGNGYFMQNVRVRNCRNDGIYSEWQQGAGDPTAGDVQGADLVSVQSFSNAGNGITWAGPHDSHWIGVLAFHNAGKGFYVKQNANWSGAALKATFCHSWGTEQTYAWHIEGQVHCMGCEAEGASVVQILFSGSDSTYTCNGSSWIGGIVQSATGSTTGIEVGVVAGAQPISLNIDTVVWNCITAVFKLTNEGGGNRLKATVYQTSGATIVGTPNVNTLIELVVGGVANLGLDTRVDVVNGAAKGLRTLHNAGATPTGGTSGDLQVGTGKIWVNDAGTWKSVAIA